MKQPFRPRFELLESRQMLSAADLTDWSGIGNLSNPNNYSVISSSSAGGTIDGRRNGTGETAGYLADTSLSVPGGVLSAATSGGFGATGSLTFDASTNNSSIVDPVFYYGFFDKDNLTSGAFGFTLADQTASSFRFRASAGTTQTAGTGTIVSQGAYTFDLDVNNADSGANKVRFRLFIPSTLAIVLDLNVTIPGGLALQADSFGILQPVAASDADATFGLTVTDVNYSGESQIQAPVDSADFDGDSDVDGADFLIWQRGLGLASQTNNDQGDADNNGAVDAADLTVWTTQFGDVEDVTPATPTSLNATAISSTRIDLTWLDVADNETGYEVDRATDDQFTQNLLTTNIAANANSFSATGLAASTTYYFRVRAAHSTLGDSANSNTGLATTTPASSVETRYLDLDSGSDSADGLTAATPWRTMAKALAAAPLSQDTVVFIASGTYTQLQQTLTDPSPSRTGTVTFKPAIPGTVTLQGVSANTFMSIYWRDVRNVRLEGLKFLKASLNIINTENFEFVNNDVTDASLWVWGADGALVDGNDFQGYTSGNSGMLFRDHGHAFGGVFTAAERQYRHFRNDNLVISNNTLDMEFKEGDGIQVINGTNLLLDNNDIQGILTTSGSHGDSIQLVEVNTSLINGNIMRSGRGIIVHHLRNSDNSLVSPFIPGVNHDLTFTNNVQANDGSDFSLRVEHAPRLKVIGNTFWGLGTSPGNGLNINGGVTDAIVLNNILSVFSVAADTRFLTRGNNRIGLMQNGSSPYPTLFAGESIVGSSAHNTLFVNYAARDLRLKPTATNAINQGVNVGGQVQGDEDKNGVIDAALVTITSTTGIPTVDRDGVSRTGVMEIGAYNF